LSEDHELLRDSARSFLDKEIDLAPRCWFPGATANEANYEANWSKMAETRMGPVWSFRKSPGGFRGMTLIDLTHGRE